MKSVLGDFSVSTLYVPGDGRHRPRRVLSAELEDGRPAPLRLMAATRWGAAAFASALLCNVLAADRGWAFGNRSKVGASWSLASP